MQQQLILYRDNPYYPQELIPVTPTNALELYLKGIIEEYECSCCGNVFVGNYCSQPTDYNVETNTYMIKDIFCHQKCIKRKILESGRYDLSQNLHWLSHMNLNVYKLKPFMAAPKRIAFKNNKGNLNHKKWLEEQEISEVTVRDFPNVDHPQVFEYEFQDSKSNIELLQSQIQLHVKEKKNKTRPVENNIYLKTLNSNIDNVISSNQQPNQEPIRKKQKVERRSLRRPKN